MLNVKPTKGFVRLQMSLTTSNVSTCTVTKNNVTGREILKIVCVVIFTSSGITKEWTLFQQNQISNSNNSYWLVTDIAVKVDININVQMCRLVQYENDSVLNSYCSVLCKHQLLAHQPLISQTLPKLVAQAHH